MDGKYKTSIVHFLNIVLVVDRMMMRENAQIFFFFGDFDDFSSKITFLRVCGKIFDRSVHEPVGQTQTF